MEELSLSRLGNWKTKLHNYTRLTDQRDFRREKAEVGMSDSGLFTLSLNLGLWVKGIHISPANGARSELRPERCHSRSSLHFKPSQMFLAKMKKKMPRKNNRTQNPLQLNYFSIKETSKMNGNMKKQRMGRILKSKEC